MRLTIATIVCAYNESQLLAGCLHSLLAQTRLPDDILVINNASTDETGAVARAVPGVRVVDEPNKSLVVARETARRATQADIVALGSGESRRSVFGDEPEALPERREQRLSQAEASVLVEDAAQVREDLGRHRAHAQGE